MGDHPRVTGCGGEESRKGHAAFTYRLNQITEDNDSFRNQVVSKRYNVASALRWRLKDATAITLERTNCNTAPAMPASRDGCPLLADSVEKVGAAPLHLHRTAKAAGSGVATRNLEEFSLRNDPDFNLRHALSLVKIATGVFQQNRPLAARHNVRGQSISLRRRLMRDGICL
jgi:hypothetical protein